MSDAKNSNSIESESGGVPVTELTQTPLTIDDLLEAVSDLGEKRGLLLKAVLATYISTFLDRSDPIWLMVVGNPSSNKTTIVDLLKEDPDVFRVDSLTSNPFSSGQKDADNPKDLLPLLDGKCFVVKEYATVLSRSEEMVKKLIGDLVAIYDGEFIKHSPTRGTVKHRAVFSHIGCVTPMALQSRQRYMSAVGARFLFLRLPALSEEERSESLNEIWNHDSKRSKADVALLICRFCKQLKEEVKRGIDVDFPDSSKQFLNQLSKLVARARGIVIRDESENSSREPIDIQIEEPFRALKQLMKFAKCLALVAGNSVVGDPELEIVKHIALSSMDLRRADILAVFEQQYSVTVNMVSEMLRKNDRTVRRHLSELVSLGILHFNKNKNQLAGEFSLKPDFRLIFGLPKEATPSEVDDNYIRSIFGPETVITNTPLQ